MASFSIIVPVYKAERYLRQCLDSIVNQTYADFEVILVDDGSPDQCGAIADEYAQKDARFKVIHQENKGVCIARKIGIQHASKPYVTWVDGDDYIGPDVLKTLNTIVEAYAPDIVAFDSKRVKDDGTILYIRKNEMPHEKLLYTSMPGFFEHMIYDTTKEHDGSKLMNPLDMGLWGKAYKREIITKSMLAVPGDVSLGEDMAAVYNALCDSKTIYVSKMDEYYYRMNESSITNVFREDELRRKQILFEYLTHSAQKIPQRNKDIYAFWHILDHFSKTARCLSSYKEYSNAAHSILTPDLCAIIARTEYPKMAAKYKVKFFMLKRHFFLGFWLIAKIKRSI